MRVELEVTLRCTSRCPACSRHCNFLEQPDSDMSAEQLGAFYASVQSRTSALGVVSVLGGEPMLHPEIGRISRELHRLRAAGKILRLQLITNGVLDHTDVQGLYDRVVVSRPAAKSHRCQLMAPADTGQQRRSCRVPHTCGVAVSAYGCYPCGAGGAIARLFWDGRYRMGGLPAAVEDFGDLEPLCSLCQRSARVPLLVRDHGSPRSKSFRKALRRRGVA